MEEQGGDKRLVADARRSGKTGPNNSGVVQERVVIVDRPDRSRTITTSHVRPGGTRSMNVEEIMPSSRTEAQITAAVVAEMAPPPSLNAHPPRSRRQEKGKVTRMILISREMTKPTPLVPTGNRSRPPRGLRVGHRFILLFLLILLRPAPRRT